MTLPFEKGAKFGIDYSKEELRVLRNEVTDLRACLALYTDLMRKFKKEINEVLCE